MSCNEENIAEFHITTPETLSSNELRSMAKRSREMEDDISSTQSKTPNTIRIPLKLLNNESKRVGKLLRLDDLLTLDLKNHKVKVPLMMLIEYSPPLRDKIIEYLSSKSAEENRIINSNEFSDNNAPRIPVIISNHSYLAILDGGSSINVISESVAIATNAKILQNSKPLNVVLGHGQSILVTKKIEKLIFSINNHNFIIDAYVLPNVDYDLLIGRPWLNENNVVTYWKDGIFEIDDGNETFELNTSRQQYLIENQTFYRLDDSTQLCETYPLAEIRLTSTETNLTSENTLMEQKVSESELNEYSKVKLQDILETYSSTWDSNIPNTKTALCAPHSIALTDTKPVAQKYYRMSPKENEFIKNTIDTLLCEGKIRKSNSPWASPVVVVSKKDGNLRFCVNYQALNDKTVKDKYPLPIIDDLLLELTGSNYFSSFDLFSGYHQIPMNTNDIDKTTFITKYGCFAFNVLPFGLCNAPATFQRCMEEVFKPIQQNIIVYLDDITIYSKTIEEHFQILIKFFELLNNHNLRLNLKKCNFFKQKLNFLGHTISKHGIEKETSKTEAIQNFPTPNSLKSLQSFLGLCSYYRRFVKNFSEIAAPLFKLTRKDVIFNWQKLHEDSFTALKDALCQDVTLSYPDYNKPFNIYSDASNTAIGAVLSQTFEKNERPLYFFSRKLTDAERNYSTIEKEILAVVSSLKKFRQMILGKSINIYTDHNPIRFLTSTKDPTGKFARWLFFIRDFDAKVHYIKGKENVVADSLSRIDAENRHIESITETDNLIHLVKNFIVTGELPDDKMLSEKICRITPSFRYVESELMKLKSGGGMQRVILSETQRKKIMNEAHDGLGHFGLRTTFENIVQSFWWPSMNKDISEYVKSCPICQLTSFKSLKLDILKIPKSDIFSMFGIDFVGPLPTTVSGNRYIIVATEYLSRWPIAAPLKTANAMDTAKFLFENIICTFGIPKVLISDQGTHFLNEVVSIITGLFSFHHRKSTAYHPQTNGLTERFNKTIVHSLLKYVNETGVEWDKHINSILLSYRFRKHSSTGMSPFKLVYGVDPNFIDYTSEYEIDAQKREGEIKELNNSRDKLISDANESLLYSKGNPCHNNFKIGDKVLIRTPASITGNKSKLELPLIGPARIKKVFSNNTVELETITKREIPMLVHISRLKPFVSIAQGTSNELKGEKCRV